MKQITITVPDNCEIKQDGNTYTIVEKENKLTYNDVADKMFLNKEYHYYIDANGNILKVTNSLTNYKRPNNTTSEKQAEKLLAINKLMNVAKYLNGDWQPDWDNFDDEKWAILIENDKISVNSSDFHYGDIYFKSKELAKKAIEILGEECLKLALCTDY